MYHPLHVHTTTGSIGDSILRIPEYVRTVREQGLKAAAISDHGSMSAIYEFADACDKENIKPIFGMEAYEVKDQLVHEKWNYNHLVLIAKTDEGLSNLIKIHNNAQVEGFYYKPCTDKTALKYWGKGIIALSACVKGSIPQAILEGDLDKALELVCLYKQCFDEFYLEIQPGKFEEQTIVNDGIVLLSELTNTPLVLTNDVHYLKESDATVHDYHIKLSRSHDSKKALSDELIYSDTVYWLMSEKQIREAFPYSDLCTEDKINRAIESTQHIADICNVTLDTKIHMPCFLENTAAEDEYVAKQCQANLLQISPLIRRQSKHASVLRHELKTISQKGFSGYFLVVQDYINWAREQGIPIGPGRGSAAGCLVAYLLGITSVDPIEYNLYFERFMDAKREAIPDIDVDTTPEGREAIINYLKSRYGEDSVAQISTLHIRKAKSSIRDTCRILKYPVELGDAIAKLIPSVAYDDEGTKESDLDIETSVRITPELQEYRKQYPDIFDLAIKLEGLPKAMSIHAAGIIIAPMNLRDRIPLIRGKQEGILATSLNLEDAEKTLVKFDILSVSSLQTVHNVEAGIGVKFPYDNPYAYQDQNVWNTIGSINTTGLFQIGSNIYKQRMYKLKPGNINELAACLALIRGPCISTHLDEQYIRIRQGLQKPEHVHMLYDLITSDTNGIIIYQEQVMKLATAYGLDQSIGYRLVKSLAKKKLEEVKTYHDQFIESTIKECNVETAERIWKMIEVGAQYLFNKSHAVAYATLCYETAWIKTYYPLEYMRQLLTDKYESGKKEEYSALVKDCKNIGIKFLKPDINLSQREFTIEGNCLRVGFCAITHLKGGADALLIHREQGYESVDDLVEIPIKEFNKTCAEMAICSGLLNSLMPGKTLKEQYAIYAEARSKKSKLEVPEIIKIGKEQFHLRYGFTKKLEKACLGANYEWAGES